MRRFICVTMVVLFLATIFSGLAESHVHYGRPGLHIFIAVLFILATLAHTIVNRRAPARNLMGAPKKIGT